MALLNAVTVSYPSPPLMFEFQSILFQRNVHMIQDRTTAATLATMTIDVAEVVVAMLATIIIAAEIMIGTGITIAVTATAMTVVTDETGTMTGGIDCALVFLDYVCS